MLRSPTHTLQVLLRQLGAQLPQDVGFHFFIKTCSWFIIKKTQKHTPVSDYLEQAVVSHASSYQFNSCRVFPNATEKKLRV